MANVHTGAYRVAVQTRISLKNHLKNIKTFFDSLKYVSDWDQSTDNRRELKNVTKYVQVLSKKVIVARYNYFWKNVLKYRSVKWC